MRTLGLGCLVLAACEFTPGIPSLRDGDVPVNDGTDSGGSDEIDAMVDAPIDAPGDFDGDTILDPNDNCVQIANTNQRDWDGDARGDACDGCPHIANEGVDGDADGVPDACDPRPGTGGDARLLWLGFYDANDIAGWIVIGGTWSVSGGVLAQTSTSDAQLLSPLQYQRVYLATSVDITATLGTNALVGMCIGQTDNNSDYDCCDVLVNGSGTPVVEAATTLAGRIQVGWAGSVAAAARVDIQGDTVGANTQCKFKQSTVSTTVIAGKDEAQGRLLMWTDNGGTATFRYLFAVQIGS